MYDNRRITVVIPCLNEEKGIVKVLSRMPSFVDEVIVVDNDSTDRTADVASRFGARIMVNKALVVIHDKCYGCGLCADICPQECIRMIPAP